MGGERFQLAGRGSFFGDYLYDRIVPQGLFLRQLRDAVPWDRFTYKLVKYYRGRAQVGRPPYDPSVLLRMLLLSYMYNLPESGVGGSVRRTFRPSAFWAWPWTTPCPTTPP